MIPMPRAATPIWQDSEPLECLAVVPETPGVRTFVFRPPSGATFVYRAGQFLTLELPLPGGTVQRTYTRTYTMSSSPVVNAYVSITIKPGPESVAGRWMMENLKPGMRIKAYGPSGLFHLPPQPDGKYLFISAGSGVTPVMSMAATLCERGEDPDMTFIQVARRPSELIFRRKLEYMAGRVQGVKLHFVVSQGRYSGLLFASHRQGRRRGLISPARAFCAGSRDAANGARGSGPLPACWGICR
jgi:stachydrine N-demethylase, reductase component